jgi:hypothetical protein
VSNPDYPPSGCHHCGLGRRLHFQRWTDAAGWHTFTEPSRELIAERMRAKYAGRTTTPTTNDLER